MATSTQDMVRPGECVDLYYYDGETSKKQCFATTVNTRYAQAFNNLGAGSSVFTIPPQNGIQDVVLTFTLKPVAGANNGIALPRGWGYALIKQVSFRYGGSSQYFLTGDQILQNALRKQPDLVAADQIFNLGGQILQETDLNSAKNYANVVLTLPHNSVCSGVGKPHPLPSDLLTQQIQVTVELNDPSSIVINNSGGAFTGFGSPAQLASAQFQVQQVMLNNQGDALARRVDMAQNAYAYPTEFVQQVQRIRLVNQADPQELVLTGFRSGEVKAIHCWLTNNTDLDPTVNQPFKWYQPDSIQMTYAGEIFARFDKGSAVLWNLINGNKVPAVDNIVSVWNAGTGVYDNTATLSYWTELPFAQTMVDEDSHSILVHGKPITNGIVNLTVTPPSASADWVLNVSYIYNTTLLFSQGTADYVF